ncbi:aldehyde dehydrogenase family protein [Actinomadura miaoliensis]|uniref:aldehyde dehydrogenase family protein n=1 Tax=Actinomadura miaoliensis TaxID=430685 RepID=UPI003CD09D0B
MAAGGPEDVRAAVDAAQEAFPGWAATPPAARRALLIRAADLLESRLAEFTQVMVRETGGTRSWARVNVMVAADQMRHAATTATAPAGELAATDRPGQWSMAVRSPAGVVAAIVPWNAPLVLCARAVMVALAVGDTVVLRPVAAPQPAVPPRPTSPLSATSSRRPPRPTPTRTPRWLDLRRTCACRSTRPSRWRSGWRSFRSRRARGADATGPGSPVTPTDLRKPTRADGEALHGEPQTAAS